jgi:hypothetical protein
MLPWPGERNLDLLCEAGQEATIYDVRSIVCREREMDRPFALDPRSRSRMAPLVHLLNEGRYSVFVKRPPNGSGRLRVRRRRDLNYALLRY